MYNKDRTTSLLATRIIMPLCLVASASAQAALTLPVYESFNGADPTESYNEAGSREFVSLPGWTAELTAGGRVAVRSDFAAVNPGRILSMDNPGGGGINGIIATIDASARTVATDEVLLSFSWFDHGDEGDTEDRVFVRGSDVDPWLEVYNFALNSNNGAWTTVTSINLTDILVNGTQEFSATTQIKFQQTDNFPINTDGISIDNVFIELAQPDTVSTAAGTLTASMANFSKAPVAVGDQVEYVIRVMNPDDAGGNATNVVVTLNLPPELSLPGGTITTTSGTVTTGNTAGDTSVVVDIDTLPDGGVANIFVLADVAFQGSFTFTAQATAAADGVTAFLTDDPDNTTGSDDATATRIYPFVADLAIDTDRPRKFSVANISSTPGPSSEPVTYSSTTTDICVVNTSDQVVFIEEGVCTLLADQAGDLDWPDAEPATLDITVDRQAIRVVKDDDSGFLGSTSPLILAGLALGALLRRRLHRKAR